MGVTFSKVFCDKYLAIFFSVCIICTKPPFFADLSSPDSTFQVVLLEVWVSPSPTRKAESTEESATASFPSNGTVKAPWPPMWTFG